MLTGYCFWNEHEFAIIIYLTWRISANFHQVVVSEFQIFKIVMISVLHTSVVQSVFRTNSECHADNVYWTGSVSFTLLYHLIQIVYTSFPGIPTPGAPKFYWNKNLVFVTNSLSLRSSSPTLIKVLLITWVKWNEMKQESPWRLGKV